MALLRMIAFRPQAGVGEARAPGSSSGSTRATASGPAKTPIVPKPGPIATPAPLPATAVPAAAAPHAAPGDAQDWAAIIAATELQGAARQLAAHCVLVGREGAVVRLALDPRSKFMRTAAVEEKLAQALSKYYGEPVRLEFTAVIPQAETPAQADQRVSQEEAESARRAFDVGPRRPGLSRPLRGDDASGNHPPRKMNENERAKAAPWPADGRSIHRETAKTAAGRF